MEGGCIKFATLHIFHRHRFSLMKCRRVGTLEASLPKGCTVTSLGSQFTNRWIIGSSSLFFPVLLRIVFGADSCTGERLFAYRIGGSIMCTVVNICVDVWVLKNI